MQCFIQQQDINCSASYSSRILTAVLHTAAINCSASYSSRILTAVLHTAAGH
jgi:hypothetical protein